MKQKKYIDISEKYTSPRGGRRACLCYDKETYSIKCCDGHYHSQGIGSIYKGADKNYMFRVRNCNDNHEHNVWSDTINLTIGKVYYLQLHNAHHNACYTVLRTADDIGLQITSASTLYDDCAACIAAN